ncbi:hypothetical protein GW915_13525 [bacterium]|nr:hypothetical protein [bacterium]
MNGNFLGGLGSLGLADPMGMNMAGPFQKGAVTSPGNEFSGFTNLLDIVSDMQIADEQSGEMEQLVNSELSELSFEESMKLKAQSGDLFGDSSSLLSSLHAKGEKPELNSLDSILTQGTLDKMNSLIGAPKQMKMSSLELNLMNGAGDVQKVLGSTHDSKLSLTALQAWSMPILNGDLKQVSVGEAPQNQEQSALEFKKDFPLLSEEMLKGKTGAELKNVKIQGEELNLISSEPQMKQSLARTSLNPVSIAPEAVVAAVDDENKPSESGAKNSKVSMSASEFMVRGMSSERHEGQGMESVVKMPEVLLQPGDKRVSPQAMSFVSNKVDQLKAQGGGQLTVKLNPVELGEIQIDVRRGENGMSVTLRASNPETQKLFAGSTQELERSLNAKGATLEVFGSEKPMPVQAKGEIPGAKVHQSAEGSQDFLASRDLSSTQGSHSTRVSNVQVETRMNTDVRVGANLVSAKSENHLTSLEGMKSSGQQGESSSFEGEAKREDARERWRQLYDERESA